MIEYSLIGPSSSSFISSESPRTNITCTRCAVYTSSNRCWSLKPPVGTQREDELSEYKVGRDRHTHTM